MAPIATSPSPVEATLAPAFSKASIFPNQAVIDALTVEEKVFLLSGRSFCDTAEVARLNIPSIKTSDGPSGCRGEFSHDGPSSAVFPNASCLASTFDPALIELVGREIGKETLLKSTQLLMGPTINLHRNPRGGRNFECFSEDPVLTGVIGSAYVKGFQSQGVGACLKHLICNDRETHRKSYDVKVGMKALREVYLRPFEMIIKEAQPVALMAAYNDLNGLPCSHHAEVLRIVREEFEYDGLIMSDWFGTKDGAESLIAGVDLEMPFPVMRGKRLLAKVEAGEVSMGDIDRSVRRMLETARRTNAALRRPAERAFDNDKERIAICRQAAAAGIVLLRNEDNILPLSPSANLLVIGEHATRPSVNGGGSAMLNPPYMSAPLDAITAGTSGTVTYHQGVPTWRLVPELDSALCGKVDFSLRNKGEDAPVWTDTSDKASISLLDRRIPNLSDKFTITLETTVKAPTSGRYVLSVFCVADTEIYLDNKLLETINPPHISVEQFLFERFDFEHRINVDLEKDKPISLRIVSQSKERTGFEPAPQGMRIGLELDVNVDEILTEIEKLAQDAEQIVVMTGLNPDWEGEGSDRIDMHLPREQERMIKLLAQTGKKVVLVNQSGTPIDLRCAKGISGIVQAFYGGMECGNALVDVLFGKVNPSGRLAMTFPETLEQCPTTESFNTDEGGLVYEEESLFGYRSYEKQGLTPAFPFGFGLSYTTFEWSNARISTSPSGHDIDLTITNTGKVAGHDVVEVYVSQGSEEPRKLETFAKTSLIQPGDSASVSLQLGSRAFERWVDGAWKVSAGTWRVSLCRNVQDEVIGFDVAL